MDGFVLGPGPAGRCDDAKISIPIVHRDTRSGKWMMWYSCRSADYPKGYADSLSTGRVAFATSDDGIEWTRVDGPLEKGAVLVPGEWGSFDSTHLGVTGMTAVDGRYWMFYFGADESPLTFRGQEIYGYRMRPGMAWSDDGVNWTKIEGKAPGGAVADYGDANWASWTNGVHDGEKFVLYYTTVEGDDPDFFSTHIAYSENAVDWDYQGQIQWPDGPAFYDRRGVMTRQIQRDPTGENEWLMAYTAMDGRPGLEMRRTCAVAGSDDLIRWTHRAREPLLGPTGLTGLWDSMFVSAPQLIRADDCYHLYYYGLAKSGADNKMPAGIGLATSSLEDPWNFTRIEAGAD